MLQQEFDTCTLPHVAETGQGMKGLLQEEGTKTDSHEAVLPCSPFPLAEKNSTEDPTCPRYWCKEPPSPGSHASAADTANGLNFGKKIKIFLQRDFLLMLQFKTSFV